MEISAIKKPLRVMVYTDISKPITKKLLDSTSTALHEVVVVSSLTDAMCIDNIDVVIVEAGEYIDIIRSLKLCNRNLASTPYLVLLHTYMRPKSIEVDYIFAQEATPNVLMSMIKLLIDKKEQNIHNTCTASNTKKVDIEGLQKKYIPLLSKLKQEIREDRI